MVDDLGSPGGDGVGVLTKGKLTWVGVLSLLWRLFARGASDGLALCIQVQRKGETLGADVKRQQMTWSCGMAQWTPWKRKGWGDSTYDRRPKQTKQAPLAVNLG